MPSDKYNRVFVLKAGVVHSAKRKCRGQYADEMQEQGAVEKQELPPVCVFAAG